MRIAYLDCFSGISGDMFLGALVAAGVPIDLLRDSVAALEIDAELQVSQVMRSGISAVKVDVIVDGEKDMPREVYQAQKGAHHLHHTFVHGHDQHHAAAHEATAPRMTGTAHKHEHGRSLRVIREIIARTPLSTTAKATATAIFEALGAVEAAIHNVEVDNIHFHEVGSTDAIVDITCAAVGAEALGVDQWVCSPLNVGGGTVECAHGRFPVPAPATLELLRQCKAPVYSSGIEKELVTPTGAAIVHVLAKRFGSMPAMKVAAVGYGGGYRDLPGHANVVRLAVGEAAASAESDVETVAAGNTDVVAVLEANLDDISPQVIGYVFDRALSEGALDVFSTPAQMKKNRPGLVLTVLCRPEDADRLARLLFAETTTLGIRMRQETRRCLERRYETVQTPWGDVRLKVGSFGGEVTNCAPEYEDCRSIAVEHKIPLKKVMQEAVRLYWERNHEQR